jgi:hypothetical protein
LRIWIQEDRLPQNNLEQLIVAYEIHMEPELRYARNLWMRLGVKVFNQPLLEQLIIQPDDLMQLFSNIEVIASVNREVMKEFEARSGEDTEVLLVGDIFLRMVGRPSCCCAPCTG